MISWQAITELSSAAVRAALEHRDTVTVRIHGHSMRPLLRHGDQVRLRRLRGDHEPRVGDVIAAEHKAGLLLHRVISTRDEVQTQGDAAAAPDPPVTRRDILGIATDVETRAGIWLPLLGGRATGAALRGLRRLRGQLR